MLQQQLHSFKIQTKIEEADPRSQYLLLNKQSAKNILKEHKIERCKSNKISAQVRQKLVNCT